MPLKMREGLAKLTSNILNPFLVSSAVIILLSFDSSTTTSDALKWSAISLVFTVLPVLAVIVYLVRTRNLDGLFVNSRRQRNRIYLLATALAVVGCLVLRFLGAPVLLTAAFTAGLAAIIIFMGINLLWKISLHTAFVAASVTVLTIVYGSIGALTVVLLPPVAWARIELRLHSLAQVVAGALLAAAIVFLVFRLFGLTGTRA